ncbi:Hypothetical predicted protein [Olea europaea subsp. europaea]|uniref:Uncharacterized protein n=1 Tax=Olea europaea subsp. europaea TaxID=158383 RepID=A0A8S0QZD7_OLEEU|nr:Hypothetical predicted protein [Olea europaea subsp. europaea]
MSHLLEPRPSVRTSPIPLQLFSKIHSQSFGRLNFSQSCIPRALSFNKDLISIALTFSKLRFESFVLQQGTRLYLFNFVQSYSHKASSFSKDLASATSTFPKVTRPELHPSAMTLKCQGDSIQSN